MKKNYILGLLLPLFFILLLNTIYLKEKINQLGGWTDEAIMLTAFLCGCVTGYQVITSKEKNELFKLKKYFWDTIQQKDIKSFDLYYKINETYEPCIYRNYFAIRKEDSRSMEYHIYRTFDSFKRAGNVDIKNAIKKDLLKYFKKQNNKIDRNLEIFKIDYDNYERNIPLIWQDTFLCICILNVLFRVSLHIKIFPTISYYSIYPLIVLNQLLGFHIGNFLFIKKLNSINENLNIGLWRHYRLSGYEMDNFNE